VLPYGGKRARFARVELRDLSKRATYVKLDLLVRAVSALGLVALGVAGWLLQARAQDARESLEKRDRESRRYLPMVRTLTDLEMVVSNANTLLARSGELRLGSRDLLSTAADVEITATLLSLPESEPNAKIHLPNLASFQRERQPVQLTVEQSAFLLADLLRVVALADAQGSGVAEAAVDVGLGSNGTVPVARVRFTRERTMTLEMLVRPESVQAWNLWTGGEASNLFTLRRAIPAYTRALEEQTIRTTQKVMNEHPEFGDQYVAIRGDAARWRRQAGSAP
jgi:hypothetical protein